MEKVTGGTITVSHYSRTMRSHTQNDRGKCKANAQLNYRTPSGIKGWESREGWEKFITEKSRRAKIIPMTQEASKPPTLGKIPKYHCTLTLLCALSIHSSLLLETRHQARRTPALPAVLTGAGARCTKLGRQEPSPLALPFSGLFCPIQFTEPSHSYNHQNLV